MNSLERIALYNSLRMNWLMDKTLKVQPWQVEDYRSLMLEDLFKRLSNFGIVLNKNSFIAYTENSDSPEEFADSLIGDESLDFASQDQIYLLIFELWRRLCPEKPSLSVFCDELDRIIHAYDQEKIENPQAIQDILSSFEIILDENADSGANPQEVFAFISQGCANDVEEFIYDYTFDQIEQGNAAYASELLDSFLPFMQDPHWFECLRVHLLALDDKEEANLKMRELLKKAYEEKDLDFNFEILALMVKAGERGSFLQLVKQSIPLLETEEDFKELLSISADYMHYLDQDKEHALIESLISERRSKDLETPFRSQDPHLKQLMNILESRK